MLTTALIVVPLVGAILVWVLPLSRESTSGLALLVALAEVGLWLGSARNFDFGSDVQQYSTTREWFDQLGISYSVGLYGFQFWLVGLDRRRRRVRDRLRRLGRARAQPRVLRAPALPRRRARRRLRGAGPDRLLRLLRGDADPHLRAGRRVGRPAARQGDGHVRHLHDGGLAPDARVDRRARRHEGDVPARRPRHELERLDLPRLPRRVRRQGAALPVPRLAAPRVHRRRRPRWARSSPASSRRPPSSGSSGSSCRTSPSPWRTSARSSSCSLPRRSSTAPCSPSASRTSAESSRTRRWPRWASSCSASSRPTTSGSTAPCSTRSITASSRRASSCSPA